MKHKMFLLGKYMNKKMSKCIDKYVDLAEFFCINLFVLSVTGGIRILNK